MAKQKDVVECSQLTWNQGTSRTLDSFPWRLKEGMVAIRLVKVGDVRRDRSGIVLPKDQDDCLFCGDVVGSSSDAVEVGQRVFFDHEMSRRVVHEGHSVYLVDVEDVLAVLEEAP